MLALLATYLITYCGAALALVNPYYGLLAYISFAIIRPDQFLPAGTAPGNYSRILAIAVLVGWSLGGFGNWRLTRSRPLLLALAGFLGWLCVSALVAGDQDLAWRTVEQRAKIVLPVLIGFTLIDSARRLQQLGWVLIASQSVVAVAAHLSVYVWGTGNWLYFGYEGFDNNDAAAGFVTVAGFAFAMGLAETGWRKWTALAAAGLMVNAVLMTGSRGGMLALLVVGVVTLLTIFREPRHYRIFALAVLGGIVLAGPFAVERFSTILYRGRSAQADDAAESRVRLWKYGWQMMLANPWVGVGPGHFQATVARSFGTPKAAHSIWIENGAESGFPGLALLAGFYLLALRRVQQLFHRPPGQVRWLRDAARMVLLSLSGFLVAASFLTLAALEQPYFVVLFAAGLLELASQVEQAVQPAGNECGLVWPPSATPGYAALPGLHAR